jgi:hypothetical protein
MDLLRRDLLLIPYGSAGFFPDKLKLTGFSTGGLSLWTASPCVIVDRGAGQPLRCHQMPADFSPPPAPEAMRDTAGKLFFLQRYLHSLCGVWQGPPKAFIDAYFAAVNRDIAANRDMLEERVRDLAGLAGADDFVFSAPLPLPRAHLHLAPRADAPTVRAEDVVTVDFAFWTGRRLLAVDMDTGATPTPKQRRAWERIGAYGIDALRLKPAALAGPPSLSDSLGADFARFWDGDPIPRTPFRGPRIADPVAAGRQISASKT